MSGMLEPCKCEHLAYEHHFNLYAGYKGERGRGKCAHTGCGCVSFRVPK